MKSPISALSLLVIAHTNSALAQPGNTPGGAPQPYYAPPPPPPMVEAQPLPSTSITLSPVHLILPIIEASAEFRLGRKLGVMGILGFGRVDEFSAFEIGAQGRFYLLGDFASGLNIALEAMYIGIETMPDVEVRGAAEGLAIGPLIGYKWVSSAGFTVDLQAGAEVMVVNAEASSGGSTAMSQSDDILPVLNLNLGWSF